MFFFQKLSFFRTGRGNPKHKQRTPPVWWSWTRHSRRRLRLPPRMTRSKICAPTSRQHCRSGQSRFSCTNSGTSSARRPSQTSARTSCAAHTRPARVPQSKNTTSFSTTSSNAGSARAPRTQPPPCSTATSSARSSRIRLTHAHSRHARHMASPRAHARRCSRSPTSSPLGRGLTQSLRTRAAPPSWAAHAESNASHSRRSRACGARSRA